MELLLNSNNNEYLSDTDEYSVIFTYLIITSKSLPKGELYRTIL